MKKIILMMIAFMLSLSCISCNKTNNPNTDDRKSVVASYIKENADGTEVYMVDDKPFLYLGVETRLEAYTNCDNLEYTDYEKYFEKAKDIGFNVMAVSVDWADIEKEEGEYDFDLINKILGYGLKYGIKVDLLWYSALMCGDSHEWHLPDYIFDETPRYTLYNKDDHTIKQDYIQNSTNYGIQTFLRIDDETFMQREYNVVNALMEHIYEWEEARDFPKVLIGVQVYNEVDYFPEVRIFEHNVSLNGKPITKDEAWNTVKTAMNNCAKAFKSSPYQVVTRTNLLRPECAELGSASGVSPIDRALDLYNLQYLDCVGYDPYLNDLTNLKATIDLYQQNLPKNFTHIAENGRKSSSAGGTYANPEGEILLSISKNCGYILYELASPVKFDNDGYGQGIVDPVTLENYVYTDKIRTMTKALVNVGPVAAAVAPKDFAAFNIDSTNGKDNWSKTISTSNVKFTFSTSVGAKGFAIVYDGYIYCFADRDATISMENGEFGEIEIGSFVNNEWVTNSTLGNYDGTIQLLEKNIYRIKITAAGSELVSNTDLFKG